MNTRHALVVCLVLLACAAHGIHAAVTVQTGTTTAGSEVVPHVAPPTGALVFRSGVNFSATYAADNTSTLELYVVWENQGTAETIRMNATTAFVQADDGATDYTINWYSTDIGQPLSDGFDDLNYNDTMADGVWTVSAFMNDNGTETNSTDFYNITISHKGVTCADGDIITSCNISDPVEATDLTQYVTKAKYDDLKDDRDKWRDWTYGAAALGLGVGVLTTLFLSNGKGKIGKGFRKMTGQV